MKEIDMKFKKELFSFEGPRSEIYLKYDGRFVARFKYMAPKANANKFMKFLLAEYSVEEYFEKLNSGMAPLNILREKGYLNFNEAKILKKNGYPVTPEGKAAYLRNS